MSKAREGREAWAMRCHGTRSIWRAEMRVVVVRLIVALRASRLVEHRADAEATLREGFGIALRSGHMPDGSADAFAALSAARGDLDAMRRVALRAALWFRAALRAA